MSSTRDLVKKTFNSLQIKHGFITVLKEVKLDKGYMMKFDSENNAILFDPQRIDENFEQGLRYGVYRGYNIEKLILFAVLHELGHYYDYQNNPRAFYIGSKAEYILMELNGMEYAKKLVPPEMTQDFHEFNQIILESYKRDLPE
ncbi:hypothetical protein [Paenibacillus polymyxa]|uniref:hypothetical protein n=1 Tax=Paenibacillus polymyxa TaxID=1406 RepID=UPI0025B6C808|nr:hypothetical protein [Paenibacillus polymyxa]MDN4084090.1 hypothetical protein [Paenibacillus polymyxa]MDN4087059.1 hypothetical protein [Paenibacillus polymyxa]MDN4108680.1 hypothetical protein [Paenibacillus polymyxa]MEE4566698.1 hypothetical protein [Paenibacillus polymyxa]